MGMISNRTNSNMSSQLFIRFEGNINNTYQSFDQKFSPSTQISEVSNTIARRFNVSSSTFKLVHNGFELRPDQFVSELETTVPVEILYEVRGG